MMISTGAPNITNRLFTVSHIFLLNNLRTLLRKLHKNMIRMRKTYTFYPAAEEQEQLRSTRTSHNRRAAEPSSQDKRQPNENLETSKRQRPERCPWRHPTRKSDKLDQRTLLELENCGGRNPAPDSKLTEKTKAAEPVRVRTERGVDRSESPSQTPDWRRARGRTCSRG
jgi:hypothetical protein